MNRTLYQRSIINRDVSHGADSRSWGEIAFTPATQPWRSAAIANRS
jgi:hypothetical protein